jgi:hypothetical protein
MINPACLMDELPLVSIPRVKPVVDLAWRTAARGTHGRPLIDPVA